MIPKQGSPNKQQPVPGTPGVRAMQRSSSHALEEMAEVADSSRTGGDGDPRLRVQMTQGNEGFVADAIARQAEVPIGAISARRDSARPKKLFDLRARRAEEGAEPAAALRAHARQAQEARAARQAEEKGLGLVFGRVAERNEVGARLPGGAAQKL